MMRWWIMAPKKKNGKCLKPERWRPSCTFHRISRLRQLRKYILSAHIRTPKSWQPGNGHVSGISWWCPRWYRWCNVHFSLRRNAPKTVERPGAIISWCLSPSCDCEDNGEDSLDDVEQDRFLYTPGRPANKYWNELKYCLWSRQMLTSVPFCSTLHPKLFHNS